MVSIYCRIDKSCIENLTGKIMKNLNKLLKILSIFALLFALALSFSCEQLIEAFSGDPEALNWNGDLSGGNSQNSENSSGNSGNNGNGNTSSTSDDTSTTSPTDGSEGSTPTTSSPDDGEHDTDEPPSDSSNPSNTSDPSNTTTPSDPSDDDETNNGSSTSSGDSTSTTIPSGEHGSNQQGGGSQGGGAGSGGAGSGSGGSGENDDVYDDYINELNESLNDFDNIQNNWDITGDTHIQDVSNDFGVGSNAINISAGNNGTGGINFKDLINIDKNLVLSFLYATDMSDDENFFCRVGDKTILTMAGKNQWAKSETNLNLSDYSGEQSLSFITNSSGNILLKDIKITPKQ